MEYTKLFNTTIARLGVGCATHSNETSQQIPPLAIQNGINYFDTATFYQAGLCQQNIHNALKDFNRTDYILCDKICLQGLDINTLDIKDFFEAQLRDSGVDYFDVYLIQAVSRLTIDTLKKNPQILDYLNEQRRLGRIKYFGFSFHDNLEVLKEAITLNVWDVVQIQINFLDWYDGISKQLYDYLSSLHMPIIAMNPCKGGTIIKYVPDQFKILMQKNFPTKNFFKISLKFLMSLKNVSIILTGAATPTEFIQNLDWINDSDVFTQQDEELCKLLIKTFKQYNYIPCTNCKYCLSVCPQRIQIPALFLHTNNLIVGVDTSNNRSQLNYLIRHTADLQSCLRCGKCMRICPQHLPIIQYFNIVTKFV